MLGTMGYGNVEAFRKQFPVTRELIYLNHAAIAPLCGPAAEAMKNLANEVADFGSLHYGRWMEEYARLRSAAARLVGAAAEEIAIVKNTSEGIATVARGMDWQPGDRIIVFREEFPANRFPWVRLEAEGVKLTWLSIYDPLERIAEALAGARLLAISFVNFLSGFRVNLAALGSLCRQHGCFFFVDAIQGLGVYPVDVKACRIDALAADGHKWLLGPEGNGILYVSREWQDRIEPAEFGWTNTADYGDYASTNMKLRNDAGRYECGTLNTISCFGLRAAIEFLLQAGAGTVCANVNALAEQAEAGVRSLGYKVAVPRTSETGSGIVSFQHPAIDARKIVSDLKRERILAASRGEWVRIAPHFYITPDEIARTLDCLPAV